LALIVFVRRVAVGIDQSVFLVRWLSSYRCFFLASSVPFILQAI